MTANELRIGNLVTAKSPERQEWESPVVVTIGYLEMFTTDKVHFKPLPLTEERLLKFGFVTTQWDNFDSYRLEIGNNDYAIVIYSDGRCEVGDIIITKINYVHQLQNLYFALKGEELKFKSE